MPRFSDKDLMGKAHSLAEAWMWPHSETRTDEDKARARVLRQILFEEMKAHPDDEFNPMQVQSVTELLGDCNPMGKVIQNMHCDVEPADIELCLQRSFLEMLHGPGQVSLASPTPEQVARAKEQVGKMRGVMEAYLEEGVNPLAFSTKKLLSH
jgi:hypothetical protein